MNSACRIASGFAAMFQSEAQKDSETRHSLEAERIAQAISEATVPEDMAKIPVRTSSAVSAAIPIGMRFWRSQPTIFDWVRYDPLFLLPNDKCAALATAITVSSAMYEVPPGAWAMEICHILAGIDDSLASAINEAVVLGASGAGPERAQAALGALDEGSASVAMSVYCAVAAKQMKARSSDLAEKFFESSIVCMLCGALDGIMRPKEFDGTRWTKISQCLGSWGEGVRPLSV